MKHNGVMKKIVRITLLTASLGLMVTQRVGAQDYAGFIERWDDYRFQVEVKEKYSKKSHRVVGLDRKTFDERDYMALFPSLKVEAGRELQCVYSSDGRGGRPRLYAKESGERYEQALEEYKKLKRTAELEDELAGMLADAGYPGEAKGYLREMRKDRKRYNKPDRRELERRYAYDSVNLAIRHMVPEDSGMGYFQYLVFSEFGDNFALFWHSNAMRADILYSRAQLEQLIQDNRNGKFEVCFNEERMLPLLEKDLSPHVTLEADKCVITLYVFMVSGGLEERTYEISRRAPYEIVLTEDKCLVENELRGYY